MMLPVYNQFTDTWFVEQEDGSLKEISNEEYYDTVGKSLMVIKTRYDGGDSGSTGFSKVVRRPKANNRC